MSDWLETLRAEVGKASLKRVAEKLRGGNGYPSETLISQVLNGKYKGKTDRLQRLVEGYFHGATVACPVMGDITRDQCDHEQRKPFAATNHTRISLFRACRGGCPHSTLEETPS